MSFFFSNRQSKKFVDVNLLHKFECALCPLYSLPNKNKDIKPSGSEKPIVYCLGQGPGKEESDRNVFFVGPTGRLLREQFSEFQWRQIRLNNITRTRSPNDEVPSVEATECCRPSIEKDIAVTKPKAIFGLGGPALNWAIPSKKNASIEAWRGHRFPVSILGHNCWFFPMNHPAYLLRGNMHLLDVLKLDIRHAYEFLNRNIAPEVQDLKRLRENTRILYNLEDIKSALSGKLAELPFVSIDLETTGARPYSEGARILTIALGDYSYSIAFPWLHPQTKWSKEEFVELKQSLYNFLLLNQTKFAHNLSFELEWLIKEFNDANIIGKANTWRDTQSSAYLLGFGGNAKEVEEDGIEHLSRGLLALDNLCISYLGFSLKDQSLVNRTNLVNEPLENVLAYNILDPRFTAKLAEKLESDIKYEGLDNIYYEHNRRIPTLVLAQIKGLPYDPIIAQKFYDDTNSKLSKAVEEINALPLVTEYRTKFGKFDVGSPADVSQILKYAGFNVEVEEEIKGKKVKKLSSADEILQAIDHPIAKNVIQIRELSKLKSTYIDPYINKEIIYPDELIHTNYTTTFTTSGRTSSNKPNVQNSPKRKNKEIRKIIIPPKSYLYNSNDFGQIEARVLAMASKDKKFINALWNDLDIHADWSLRVAKKCPKRVGGEKIVSKWEQYSDRLDSLKKEDKLFKAFRDIIKNKMVFPSFFGASTKSLSGYMGIPVDIMKEIHKEFWDEFSGIKKWQDETYAFYKKNGYVESLTGRRRYAYIHSGEIINFGIQACASDIVIDAMNRLSEYARETGKEQFQSVILIHDDLGFFLPLDSWKEDLIVIIKAMLSCTYDFINVPLTVESSIGPNWADTKEVGTFASNKLDEITVDNISYDKAA